MFFHTFDLDALQIKTSPPFQTVTLRPVSTRLTAWNQKTRRTKVKQTDRRRRRMKRWMKQSWRRFWMGSWQRLCPSRTCSLKTVCPLKVKRLSGHVSLRLKAQSTTSHQHTQSHLPHLQHICLCASVHAEAGSVQPPNERRDRGGQGGQQAEWLPWATAVQEPWGALSCVWREPGQGRPSASAGTQRAVRDTPTQWWGNLLFVTLKE